MKQVIGHRGAAGLGLENSKTAIDKGVLHGAVRLEIDVRQTLDRKLVVCHDPDLKTMAGDERKIAAMEWADLKKLKLRDGSKLLLLDDALKLAGKTPVIIEMKDENTEHSLLPVLDRHKAADLSVASFKRPLLTSLRERRPDLPLHILEHTDPLDAIHFAKRNKLQGLGINFWLLNPITYNRARKAGLSIYVYTVNSRFLAWFLHLLYPQATICTDHPERFK